MDIEKMKQDLNFALVNLGNANNQIDIAKQQIISVQAELNSDPPTEPVISITEMKFVKNFLVNDSACILFSPYTPLYRMKKNGVWGWIVRYHWIPTDPKKYRFALTLWTPDDFSISNQNVYNNGDVNTGIGGDVGHRYGAFSDIFKGKYYQTWHENPLNGYADRMISTSLDGVNNWSAPVKIGRYGEDSSFCVIDKGLPTEKLRMYVRPRYANYSQEIYRDIVMIETTDGVNWSQPVEVLKSTKKDEQYYSMSVCQVAKNKFYACVNIYNADNELVWMRIHNSTDGINFYYIQAIPLLSEFKQQYGAITFDEQRKKLILLCEQSKGKHGESISQFPFGLTRYEADVKGI